MTKVYDILNAGPRHKFMVRSKETKTPAIVHNCLSLQYLTGWRKLHHTAAVWGSPITQEVAQTAHVTYRRTKPNVVSWWDFASNLLAVWAGVSPYLQKSVHWFTDSEGVNRLAGCPAIIIGDSEFILPDGIRIRYPGLRYNRKEGYTYWNGARKSRAHVHAGLVLENLSQGIATQVMNFALVNIMLDIKRLKLDALYCGQVHDELIFTVTFAHHAQVAAIVQKWMRTAPPWWDYVVLACEGGDGALLLEYEAPEAVRHRYGGCK